MSHASNNFSNHYTVNNTPSNLVSILHLYLRKLPMVACNIWDIILWPTCFEFSHWLPQSPSLNKTENYGSLVNKSQDFWNNLLTNKQFDYQYNVYGKVAPTHTALPDHWAEGSLLSLPKFPLYMADRKLKIHKFPAIEVKFSN